MGAMTQPSGICEVRSRARRSSSWPLLLAGALLVLTCAPARAASDVHSHNDNGGGCKRSGKHCERNSQCCAGLVCMDEKCQSSCVNKEGSCNADAQCCAGLVCTDEKCQPRCVNEDGACARNAQCCAGLACESGKCEPVCVTKDKDCDNDASCCADLVCQDGKCQPRCIKRERDCDHDAQCCTDLVCVGGKCEPSCLGKHCNGDDQCCDLLVCEGKRCQSGCRILGVFQPRCPGFIEAPADDEQLFSRVTPYVGPPTNNFVLRAGATHDFTIDVVKASALVAKVDSFGSDQGLTITISRGSAILATGTPNRIDVDRATASAIAAVAQAEQVRIRISNPGTEHVTAVVAIDGIAP